MQFINEAARASTETCLLWPYGAGGNGYGVVYADHAQHAAHRYACELRHGTPPTPKHEAAHSCGNRRCVNGRHLRWATSVENHEDKIVHGRSNRGERQGSHKLTTAAVLAIRASDEPAEVLAAANNVTARHIYKLKAKVAWAWL